MTDRTQNIGFNPPKAEDLETEKSAPLPKKTKKNFKKILAKEEKGDNKKSKNQETFEKPKTEDADTAYEDVELTLEASSQKPKAKSPSLFDIASPSAKPQEAAPVKETAEIEGQEETLPQNIPPKLHEESLSALFKGYGTKEKLAMIQKEVQAQPYKSIEKPVEGVQAQDSLVDTPRDDLRKSLEITPQKNEKGDLFSRETADLSAVNPAAAAIPSAVSAASPTQKTQPAPIRAQQLQEIVDQIVSKLHTISSQGSTDTLVQLKHPPLFAGASVVIKSFESAKGEFNITFENLTQAAKQMLDMQENQNSLRFALEQKGFTVHILTATTLSEVTQFVASQNPEREKDQSGGQGSSGGRQQQEQEEEETT